MSEHKPITGELRAAMCTDHIFCDVGGLTIARNLTITQAEFDRICDAIDAVHAGLERENAELRERLAVLDNGRGNMHDGWVRKDKEHIISHVTIEVTPHIDWSRMADELDEFVGHSSTRTNGLKLRRTQMQFTDEQQRFIDEHYQLLPVDADGEPIRVGDKVTCARNVWQVTGLRLTGLAWGVCCTIFNDHGGSGTNVYPPCDLRHHHAPTVEDVLREMHAELDEVTALYVGEAIDSDVRDRDEARIFAEYAAKLRLAGDAE